MVSAERRPAAQAGLNALSACPVCDATRRAYLFVIRGLPVVRCVSCGMVSLHPQPSPEDYATFYDRSPAAADPRLLWTDSETERSAGRRYLALLQERGCGLGQLLLIAPPHHPFAEAAAAAGFAVTLHRSVSDIDLCDLPRDRFDAAVVLYQIEKHGEPLALMQRVHDALRPGGVLLVATPSLDSWPSRFLKDQWTEWRPENLYYFDRLSIQSLLLKSGFEQIWVQPERRLYTLRHIYDRARSFPRTLLTRLVRLSSQILPEWSHDLRLPITSSGILITAERSTLPEELTCSIIVPVYNERKTFKELMDALLAKELPGLRKQIIIVESNSKDGTRELALSYQGHPDVEVVLEERPRGKGHAVRTGFTRARGQIVLIQDADLEYDLNDYDSLFEPLLANQAAFVLGTRHGGAWKMREFTDQQSLATMLNVGHVFFTGLMNVLYGQRMSDPFTMFKVFRRDCLYGLTFECNRFDFDHELVIKLVRKGYRPVEIPVNYRARSFKEGKKVSLVRDPLLWIWINFKLRFTRLRRRSAA